MTGPWQCGGCPYLLHALSLHRGVPPQEPRPSPSVPAPSTLVAAPITSAPVAATTTAEPVSAAVAHTHALVDGHPGPLYSGAPNPDAGWVPSHAVSHVVAPPPSEVPCLGAPFVFQPPSVLPPAPPHAPVSSALPHAPSVLMHGDPPEEAGARPFRMLHGLPPDIGHLLSAGDKIFPQKVVRILEMGMFEYIPLNVLTDDACRLAAHKPPPLDTEFILANGKLCILAVSLTQARRQRSPLTTDVGQLTTSLTPCTSTYMRETSKLWEATS
ncbi:hypothetical protein C0992_006929 [Termitomyces sp. T32_za158]|nr:hypothetical protein C0992_006929 [Termitomyces sp. T32_za158]